MTVDPTPPAPRPRRTLTIRQLLLLIAAVALILGGYDAVCRLVYPAPADWATIQAARWRNDARKERRHGLGDSRFAETRAREFARLAMIFARDPVPWGEATYYGPFTSKLAVGQQVVTRCETPAERSELSPAGGSPGRVAAGTACVVLRDTAIDADACDNFRKIDVQLLAGPGRGAIVAIGRECLRRP